jgi:integrase
MPAQGSVWKRCTHDGKTRDTGLPATARRDAIPACRCKGGSWWWRIDAGRDPVTGERRQPIRGGYPTKAEAQEGLDDIRDQIRRGIIAHDEGKTVADWLREWLATGTWGPTTRDGYTRDVDTYLIPLLGHLRLRDLQRAHVASMLTALSARDDTRTDRTGRRGGSAVPQRSPATVDKIRRTLRSALGAALEDGLIGHNPAAGRFRQIGKRAGTGRAPAWWQPDELQAFLDSVTDDPDVALWTVVALTGLRRSEVLGLRWVDVDLTGPQPGLTVLRKNVQLRGAHPCGVCRGSHRGRVLLGGAKSDAGAGRWVPLVDLAVVELAAHRQRQDAKRAELGDHWSDHGLVFPLGGGRGRDLPGSPRRPDDVSKRHAELVATAGLPTIVLHEMRHGAISLLAAAGMPTDQIALIVGHSTDEVTRLIYVHGIKVTLAGHAQAAADLLRPRPDVPGA